MRKLVFGGRMIVEANSGRDGWERRDGVFLDEEITLLYSSGAYFPL
jgi:hypothetical protein